MFNLINQAGGLNMWNYQLQQDDTDHQRVKIVDETTTKIDVNGDLEEQTTKFDVNGKISQGDSQKI